MTKNGSQPDNGSRAAIDERVLALENRVETLAEAIRVLARGLEDLPTAGPGGTGAAQAARRAHDLLLVATSPAPAKPGEAGSGT